METVTMKIEMLLLLGMLTTNTWAQASTDVRPASRQFDGKWWANADSEERAGFIDGASDCLTWEAHLKGFNATLSQVDAKIRKYYRSNPEAENLSVVDVWEKIGAAQVATAETNPSGGEDWTNAHWYFNEDWWVGGSSLDQLGFLEGYIWCTDNRVKPKTETFSHSVNFYQKKIDAYIEAHPKADNEAVALILRRFRDKAPGAPN
jgi:hypothetical protein